MLLDGDWIWPKVAILILKKAGASLGEAWHLIAAGLQEGRVRCAASCLTSELMLEVEAAQTDVEVPCDVWRLGGVPAPGHSFWITGDVNLTVVLPGSSTLEQAQRDPLSLMPIAPHLQIRGARLDRLGVDLIVYDRSLRLESRASTFGPTKRVAGPMPPDEEIRAKLLELHRSGLNRDQVVKAIRDQEGFETVTNEHARKLIAHMIPRGRPKKRPDK